MKNITKIWFVIGVFLVAGIFTGCETDDGSEDYEDHVPADGMGSLVIYNRSAIEIEGYMEGSYITNVESWDWVVQDYDLGTYTVVILQEDGTKSYTADVEILEGVLTVLTLSYGGSSSSYFSVTTEYVDKK
jgi:hypothetical protein